MTTALDTRSQATIVGNIAAGMQSRITSFLNFAVGSVLLALSEAYAAVALWLQAQNEVILTLTRASTSDGDDLDSWMADYQFARLTASASTGEVTFGLYSPKTSAVIIPVGTLVKSNDGSLIFSVFADTTNGAYRPDLGGYFLAAGATSVDVPVVCTQAGIAGNVAAGGITLIASQVQADTVSNAVGFTNGLDAEKDPEFRTRFWAYIASLSSATEGAYRLAVRNVQQNMRVQYLSQPGLVTLYVDDGSGAPSAALVQQCQAACDAVRAGGVQVAVFGASQLAARVRCIIEVDTASGYDTETVVAAVAAALTVYINAIPEGGKLAFTRIAAIAYAASPGVTDVTSVSLNSGTADLIAGLGQTIKADSIVIDPAS